MHWTKKILLVAGLASFLLGACQGQNSTAKDSDQPAPPSSEETHLVQAGQTKPDDIFVDAAWAKDQIDQDQTVKVLEAGYGDAAYKKGHLPGAQLMDTMAIETEESDWNLLADDDLVKAFLAKGVTKDTPLFVYGEDVNAASRVAFAAYYLGVEDVHIIDGGKAAWEKAGFELTEETPQVAAVEDFGGNYPGRPEVYLKTSDDLLAAQASQPDLVVASVRSWPEFIGETSGYDYIDKAGEIKGAVWAKASETAADVNYLTNEDGTIRDPQAVFADWEEWGISKDKPVTFYCGTGWRNTTAFFVAKQAGWDDISVQDGGWYEWNLNHQKDASKYPVQLGDPRGNDVEILD
ncbi:rhodanese-like domain-containing protein [Aerococcus sp. UMB8623]|uniref:sulfurtransferase n=1 Tax=Aerococcus sp. UMB8623 TaxID=3046348 RepID=UPI00254A1D41|nr:rhodanese-like domain-containing protein [Aerococcus sp. UMB8623]MDK6687467.1 rhodanese-like domain-containing protein [Aerococcus sp. UMB8623]